MGEKSYPITVEQFQEGIELLCPCMDDYLYLYDFKKDYYYISSHALDRFCMPTNAFHDVQKTHEKFVPSGGFRNASGRSFSNETGHQAFS